jgi:hypothetical protein
MAGFSYSFPTFLFFEEGFGLCHHSPFVFADGVQFAPICLKNI